MKIALVVILALLNALGGPAKAQKGFAVLELFTSEGCSSCPPAERVLEKMAAQYANQPVYILEQHVDYWNYLGWKDPYSSKDFSQRQKDYNTLLKTETYTPQVIINGSHEFLGTDSAGMNKLIAHSLQQAITVAAPVCTVKRSNQRIVLSCTADATLTGNAIYAALVEKKAKNSVTAGENKGHTLQHINVVRDIASGTVKSSAVKLVLTITGMPGVDDYEVMVFTQQPNTRQITSATRVKLQ